MTDWPSLFVDFVLLCKVNIVITAIQSFFLHIFKIELRRVIINWNLQLWSQDVEVSTRIDWIFHEFSHIIYLILSLSDCTIDILWYKGLKCRLVEHKVFLIVLSILLLLLTNPYPIKWYKQINIFLSFRHVQTLIEIN